MPTIVFRPTSPANQNQPKMKISNFCGFCPIWMKFGMRANNEPETTISVQEGGSGDPSVGLETGPLRKIRIIRAPAKNVL